jgi:hypothetical protein
MNMIALTIELLKFTAMLGAYMLKCPRQILYVLPG